MTTLRKKIAKPERCFAAVNANGKPYIAIGAVDWTACEARKKLVNGIEKGWARCYRDGWRIRPVYVSLEKPK